MRSTAPALAVLVGALCAVAADATAAVPRLSDEVRIVRGADRPLALAGRGNEAVLALLEDAELSLRAGRPEQALVALERALRIEPRNPTVWHYLGLARLDVGDFAQAETMASRSHSLAPADRALRPYNTRLVAAARRASGRPLAPFPDGLAEQPPVEARARTELGAPAPAPAWRARADGGAQRSRRDTPQPECRIWYKDRPPNRQPPPFPCDQAGRRVPPGAVLLVSI